MIPIPFSIEIEAANTSLPSIMLHGHYSTLLVGIDRSARTSDPSRLIGLELLAWKHLCHD
ncbi:hypothetical protein M514_00729 [Trichuris suis]|uniref:Uncharacterized protein n=1 Tax=Trichuris suis TaxID=68888 RepID=A0A085N6N6_9BILA|nr:hypothetical protein M513_00729 [Trichuris suis]KFD65132.1 hypothetical protein M514_00729 [Trichuris suis]